MTRNEYLTELEQLLQNIPEAERKEIMYDYHEHFTIAAEKGKSEEEAVAALGSPSAIAKEVIANFHITRAKEEVTLDNVGRAVIAAVSLGFFNLVFVLGPFLGLCGAVFGLFAAVLALIVSPVVFIHSGWSGEWSEILSMLFLSMITLGIGLLLGVGMIYVSKFLCWIFIKYLRFNLKIIRGRS